MSATTARRPSPHRVAALVAAGVVALDLGTKELALRLLGDDVVSLGGGTFLGVVFNPTFVLGRTLGAHSLAAAAVVSLVVVALCALVCAPLAGEDRRAPLLLGLVSGAALANPGSLVLGTPGVVDFLGMPVRDGAVVFNVADVAAYLGVALMLPVVLSLAARAHREHRPQPALATRARTRAPLEIEVPLPVLADGLADAPPRVDVPERSREEPLWLDIPAPERAREIAPDLRDRRMSS